MHSFYISQDDRSIRVYKVESDLFGEHKILMGWFPLYNKHKAESFLEFLRSNPDSNIFDFFRNS